MDSKQLITLLIMAFVAAFMKEFFGWLLRSGSIFAKALLTAVRTRLAPLVLRHWRALVITFDCVMIGWTGFSALYCTLNAYPLTKVVVLYIASDTTLFWYWFRELRTDVIEAIRAHYQLNA